MKQVNLTITFDEEKLSALKRYMGKKELDLESEMTPSRPACLNPRSRASSITR